MYWLIGKLKLKFNHLLLSMGIKKKRKFSRHYRMIFTKYKLTRKLELLKTKKKIVLNCTLNVLFISLFPYLF